jgi:hypothetical protein
VIVVKTLFKQIFLGGLAVVMLLSPLMAMADHEFRGHMRVSKHEMKQRKAYYKQLEHRNKAYYKHLERQDRELHRTVARNNREMWRQLERRERAIERAMLTNAQRAMLLDMLYGRGSHAALLDPRLRNRVFMQSAVPLGMQNPLMMGYGLPTGLQNRMVLLPMGVNDHLGFPGRRDFQVGVLGQDVILYSLANGMVLDILRGAIL